MTNSASHRLDELLDQFATDREAFKQAVARLDESIRSADERQAHHALIRAELQDIQVAIDERSKEFLSQLHVARQEAKVLEEHLRSELDQLEKRLDGNRKKYDLAIQRLGWDTLSKRISQLEAQLSPREEVERRFSWRRWAIGLIALAITAALALAGFEYHRTERAIFHQAMGMTYFSMSDVAGTKQDRVLLLRKSKEQFAMAIKWRESLAMNHYNLGIIHARLGEKAAAKENFKRCIQLAGRSSTKLKSNAQNYLKSL